MTDPQVIATLYEEIDNAPESLRAGEPTANPTPSRPSGKSTTRPASCSLGDNLRPPSWRRPEKPSEKPNETGTGRARRVWDLHDPADRRPRGLSFRNQLSLVLQRDADNWQRTMRFNDVRNQIGHGTLLSERIDVSAVIQGFHDIQASLARS